MDFRELINKIDSINSEAKKEPERLAFDDAINHVKDIKFTPPSASGAKFSIANNPKFKGQDVNDKEVKLALLQDALKNFPAMLFGEIAQRIKPTTDAQIELSQFVGDISNKMDPEGSHIGQLSKPERELAIEVTKAALRGMEFERDPDQSEYKDDEDDRMESSLPWKKFETPVKEADDNKEEKIKAWADKYEKYIGVNGDTLPEGWLEYQMDTGIPSDSIETGEYENYVEKHGEEAANDLGMDIVHDNPDEFPITNAFMDDLFDIMGGLGEEEAEEVNKVLGHFGENTQDPMAGFESWVNKLGEESPLTMADDEEKSDLVKKLNELIGQEFSAGVDGTNAITSLEGIIEDPKLEQDIKKKATEDANADIRPLVKAWVEENAPDVLDQLDFGDMADEPAVGADDVEPQQEEDANNEGLGDMFKKDPTLGMNKYGLAAIHKDGKFFSIKDKKITGEFDSLDELKKHQEELLNNEDSVSEGGNAWDLAVTTGMEIIQDSNDEDEAIKRLEDEITGSNEPDESYADMVIKDYIERIKKEGFDKVRHDMDAQDFMGDPVDLEMEGNEFSKKVQDLKAQGAKKGTKFKTSDGEEHTLEGLAEFINSFYDKNTGTFPKGPEGVCTMVGKKFGEQAEQVARKFVERMAPEQEQGAEDLEELERIKSLVNF